jgi:transcriptional repressor NrdR
MAELRSIDQIAYIRFASVYQSFEDLEDLKREVDTLFAQRGTLDDDARDTLEALDARRNSSAGAVKRR